MSKPENTISFLDTSYSEYWLSMDSLHNIDHDMFFSPFKKYTCQAGCKICYISEQLDISERVMAKYAPFEITPQKEAMWDFWFDKFDEIGYNDDLVYVKNKFPIIFEWIIKNAHKFKYCMTDNAILRQHELLMHEVLFSGIMDISISDKFLNTSSTLLDMITLRLADLISRYKIGQLKFIITDASVDIFDDLIHWAKSNSVPYFIHNNFTDVTNSNNSPITNYNDWTLYQHGRLYEIKKETLHLFDDGWFFSTQDATSDEPFWTMSAETNRSLSMLLCQILVGKQQEYLKFSKTLLPMDSMSTNFKNYFLHATEYVINSDYNYIPYMLVNRTSKFINKLLEIGWINTQYGIYKPDSGNIISILTK